MEQTLSNQLKPSNLYPSSIPYTIAYPPKMYDNDTMATNYVHYLKSSPYYYPIPYYNSYNNNFHFDFPKVNIATNQSLSQSHQSNIPLKSESMATNHYNIYSNKSIIDLKILSILECLRDVYNEKEESLKNVFPSLFSKLSKFFKKVNSLILESVTMDRDKSTRPILKRSLSLGSSSSTCWNERFRVRPMDSDDVEIIIPPENIKDGDHNGDD